MYTCLRDASFRLRGTLVEHQGELVYVHEVDEDGKGFLVRIARTGDRTDWVKLSKVKIRGIKTGYINVMGYVCYMTRSPTRTYRQGLRHDNTNLKGVIDFGGFMSLVKRGENLNLPIKDKEDLILSSEYAVRGGKLYYRERVVGVYFEGKPYLNNHMVFLKESLEKCNGI